MIKNYTIKELCKKIMHSSFFDYLFVLDKGIESHLDRNEGRN